MEQQEERRVFCRRCQAAVALGSVCVSLLMNREHEHTHTEANTEPSTTTSIPVTSGQQLLGPWDVSGGVSSMSPHDRNFIGSGVKSKADDQPPPSVPPGPPSSSR
jgi:hypothetical protein